MNKKVDMFESFVTITDPDTDEKVYVDIGAKHPLQAIYTCEGGTALCFNDDDVWYAVETPQEIMKKVNKVMQDLYDKLKEEAEKQLEENEVKERKKREELEAHYENLRKKTQGAQ